MNDFYDNITTFSQWFKQNEDKLRAALTVEESADATHLVEALDEIILSFGKFSWHAETKNDLDFHFTISPNDDLELMDLSRQIIAEMPAINGWEFHYAKQANGDLSISLYDDQMDIHFVDASSWRVVLASQNKEKFELIVLVNNVNSIDEETQVDATDAIITNLIGEELKIRKLLGIELRTELADEEYELSIPITQLHYALQQ